MYTQVEESLEKNAEADRGTTERTDWAERTLVPSSEFSGEMFQTVLGHVQGVYTWECDHFPSEEEIREGMCVRVIRDCSRLRTRHRCTELTGWHGGWTPEGIGIFTTDVRSSSSARGTRRVGRATVLVRTPENSGSKTWNGIAC